MEKPRPTSIKPTEQGSNNISRRDLIFKGMAYGGAAAILSGAGDLFVFVPKVERAEREVKKKFPDPSEFQLEQADQIIKDNKGNGAVSVEHAKQVKEQHAKHVKALDEAITVSSGVRKGIDYAIMCIGFLAGVPKMVDYYTKESKRE